jgi:PII-like signaling protein
MMRVLDGEQVLMRIFIGEADKHQGMPVYQQLVEMFRREKLAGATVLRGIVGFGAKSHLHTTHLLRLSQDLPMVVEVVDSQASIDRVMPQVDQIVREGLITLEKVRVLRYAPEQENDQ